MKKELNSSATRTADQNTEINSETFNPFELLHANTTQEIAIYKDLKAFQAKYSIINRSGKTYVCWKDREQDVLEFQNIPDFHTFHAHQFHYLPAKGKAEPKKVLISKLFIESKDTTRYEGIIFDPSPSANTSNKYWNLWSGFRVTPKQGDITPFNQLIAALCSDDADCAEYMMNYLAHMVQKPGELPETAIVMRGEQGIGKGTLMKSLSLLSQNYKHLSSGASLTGTFNGHLLDSYIVFCDEIFWGGNKQDEGTLKAMITEQFVMINDKNRTAIQVRNYKRLFVASNEDWVIPVGEGDRRFFVLDCDARFKGQTEPGQFFSTYNQWLTSGGIEALMFELTSRDISEFNPRNFPVTHARVDLMLRSLSPTNKFIIDLLGKNINLESGTEVTLNATGAIRWFRNHLYQDYLNWCDSQKIRYPSSLTDFGKTISLAFGFEKQDCANWRVNWKHKTLGYYYQLDSRKEGMKRFAELLLNVPPELVFFGYNEESDHVAEVNENDVVVSLFKQA